MLRRFIGRFRIWIEHVESRRQLERISTLEKSLVATRSVAIYGVRGVDPDLPVDMESQGERVITGWGDEPDTSRRLQAKQNLGEIARNHRSRTVREAALLALARGLS